MAIFTISLFLDIGRVTRNQCGSREIVLTSAKTMLIMQFFFQTFETAFKWQVLHQISKTPLYAFQGTKKL